MIALDRPYKLDTGTAQCTNCGGNIRKYYMGLNDHRPICSKCVNTVFNMNISKTELSVPIWLIWIANKYVNHRLFLTQYKGVPINDVKDFLTGFSDKKFSFDGVVTVDSKQFVRGKPVKNGWLIAIQHHLTQRYLEIVEDEPKTVRKLLVCGNCKKPLYHKGLATTREGKYREYHCLSGKRCANHNSNMVFAHFGGNNVKLVNR